MKCIEKIVKRKSYLCTIKNITMSNHKVRVRFAPSPTGPLHIGGVRTALFNYLFAKKNGGTFILRIEDTDQNRFVPGAEKYIIDSLNWCGLTPDEGPGIGGEYGPYRQSERKEIYRQYADMLVEAGHAYIAFDTPEEIEELRKEAEANKNTFSYGIGTRENLNNSLTLDTAEVQQKIRDGVPYVIRFKMPEDEDVTENDLIRRSVTFNTTKSLDDKVLFKSDGMPTYHLANVVDDHLMEITHVIRGEEWLSSMPLHVLLYRALGWTDSKPRFAHMPLTLKPAGKGKLSKRDGDKMGFPVFPLPWKDPETGQISRSYQEDGYFPEAFINMLAFLGWNPGTEQEIFSMDELIDAFSPEHINKAGARFDPEKAKWFNKQYFQKKSAIELAGLFKAFLEEKGIHETEEKITKIVAVIQDRCGFVQDLWEHGDYFFIAPSSYEEKTVSKHWKEDTSGMLSDIAGLFQKIDKWEAGHIKETFSDYMNSKNLSFGKVMSPLRLCLVGANKGPDFFIICEILGKEETINRINTGISKINLKD